MVTKPLDVKGLADYLGMSEDWVQQQAAARAIPHSRLGTGTKKVIRFFPVQIAAYELATEEPLAPDAPNRTEIVAKLAELRSA